MTPTLLIAILLFGCVAALVVRALTLPGTKAARQLAQIDAYGYFAADEALPGQPARPGPIEQIGRVAAAHLGHDRLATLRKRLLAAGMYSTSVQSVLGLWAVSILIGGGCLYIISGSVVFVLFGALVGGFVPHYFLVRRVRLRLETIDRGVPELVDLLVVGVEAGMGFNGAMRTAATRLDGPLSDEMQLMLREQSLGASTTESLRNLLSRADTPAVGSFVRTIVQGERLGVSIGDMMRALAGEMRKRRKATAEERAQKAPLKILFPLIGLIFPSLFIVLMTPALYKIGEAFGGF